MNPLSHLRFGIHGSKKRPEEITILNEQHVAGLIQFLFLRGEARANELRQLTGNYDKLKVIASELESLGLISKEVEEKPRLTYIYRLTEKGMKVAEKLAEIDKIIQIEK